MKKLLFLFSIVLFTSCGCMYSQVPPQTIFVDENCQGIVPNYIPMFTYSDNCRVDTVFQVPDPGYVLSSFENSVNVQIIVVDEFQNVSSTVFPVTLVDSSGPVIVYKFEIVSKRIVLK